MLARVWSARDMLSSSGTKRKSIFDGADCMVYAPLWCEHTVSMLINRAAARSERGKGTIRLDSGTP